MKKSTIIGMGLALTLATAPITEAKAQTNPLFTPIPIACEATQSARTAMENTIRRDQERTNAQIDGLRAEAESLINRERRGNQRQIDSELRDAQRKTDELNRARALAE